MSQRTNSLAFAKSDCHTCKRLRRVCDRQRPICTTCQDAGNVCKGFQTRLIWEGSDLPSRRGDDSRRRHGIDCRPVPSETATPTPTVTELQVSPAKSSTQKSSSHQKRAREFSFVNWPPKRRKKQSRRAGQESREKQAGPSLYEEAAFNNPEKTGPGPEADDEPSLPASHAKDLDALPLSTAYTSMLSPLNLEVTAAMRKDNNNMLCNSRFEDWMPQDQSTGEELPWFSADAGFNNMVPRHPERPPLSPAWVTMLNDGQEEEEEEEEVERVVTSTNDRRKAEWSLRPRSDNSTISMATLRTPNFDADTFTIFASIPPRVLFSTTADQFSILLDRYDQEFCTYPVTNDLDINPFRYRRETSRGSKHLLHAIIAIACHHQNSYSTSSSPPAEFYQHKNQATALYKAAIENPDIQAQGLEALDTLLALWCIDTVESALNPWRDHLSHAYSLLELAGGIDVWSLSFRSQTQVTMLLWWDAVVALLSRRPCVMPYTYFEAVLQWEASQFWTFFELIGCPRELLVPLMQLAHLAGQSNSKSSSTRYTTKAIVNEIEANLRSYRPPGDQVPYNELDNEESLQQARDEYHSCEAIRYSLLLYTLRVFQDDETKTEMAQASLLARLRYLSRVALDHVCSIRPSSPTQKQLLLPIFLAGAETQDARHREFIRGYCRQWFETFGYHMFTSVIDILEEVWSDQDVLARHSWWGDVVDARRRAGDGDVDFCFG